MIIDSHCHAWSRWPYQPPVPDPDSRGTAEQLLHEMDLHGVDKAVIICARLKGNRDNNAYAAEKAEQFKGRLYPFFDFDGCWMPNHHKSGAARRLKSLLKAYPISGVTHYLNRDDDGSWLTSDDATDAFALLAEDRLVLSLSSYPHQHPAIRELARRFPSMPILCHHLAHVSPEPKQRPRDLKQVCKSAACDNVYIKVSGFNYCSSQPGWAFPYDDAAEVFRTLHEHFGARRMCWGSNYPVVRKHTTYEQSLQLIQTHCDFLSKQDRAWILGKTMAGLLE